MLFYIHHNSTEYKVRVEARHGRTFVRFGDEPEKEMDISFYGHECVMLHEQEVFSANILGEKTEYSVFLPAGNLQFQVESEYRRIVGLLRGQSLTNENHVYAKMPGRIAKLSCKVGQEISSGDSLLVMEAMKMENEIRASVSGKILSINVKEGQAVETGAMLIEIEPLDA
ncbi:MAG: acetyl-CoA carboxylase biotin carboxyl carrier protein subunit [Deltaproteobacteria bacterium]|nr:acetyl-CoA carboxylase biotin carboxyl carrier protein subunit [Deltaproteobacteria bacterium]MBI3296295.1 acetyl-CoA carboxylase biotin carboxyl carrier protein subunit [Deltaproteobacteria bacterium]